MINQYNQTIGDTLINYTTGKLPNVDQIKGQYSTIEKLSCKKHGKDLYNVFGPQSNAKDFTYLPINQFDNYNDYMVCLKEFEVSTDPYYFAVIDKKTEAAIGIFSFLNIDPNNRSIEMGWVLYSEKLKQTRMATEAQFLAMNYVFEQLEYRRYQWKCDSHNSPSYRAAIRLGFTFEGTLRNAVVYKNRSRDSQFFSIIPEEWFAVKQMFTKWLDSKNFDDEGAQIASLKSFFSLI
ncbi:GNAT family N-acetyltransferase [Leuconostoc miyukkimchii]|uniref:GNAT family N-acetyltransferase n=1 Tax=Leuconostoc miyukkimchii TaxID=910540 RepID=UPI001C7E1BF3|nr:GNAT family protein [Leuconostoc miyukkimchii]